MLGGSVATSTVPVLRELLVARIRERIPGARCATVEVAPVFGALREALRQALRQAGGSAPTVLRGQLPAELFFTD